MQNFQIQNSEDQNRIDQWIKQLERDNVQSIRDFLENENIERKESEQRYTIFEDIQIIAIVLKSFQDSNYSWSIFQRKSKLIKSFEQHIQYHKLKRTSGQLYQRFVRCLTHLSNQELKKHLKTKTPILFDTKRNYKKVSPSQSRKLTPKLQKKSYKNKKISEKDRRLIDSKKMWWDPSIPMDGNIMSLMPFLQPFSWLKINLSSTQIQEISTQSVNNLDIQSLIGAISLMDNKNRQKQFKHQAKMYQINHLQHLNRLFFLVSNHKMSRQKQIYIRWYLRIIFVSWLKIAQKQNIQKLVQQLQDFIPVIQNFLGSTNEELLDGKCITKILNQFQKLFFDEKINKNPQLYQKFFLEHAENIMKNTRLITFFNIIYQMNYLYLQKNCGLNKIIDFLKSILYKLNLIKQLSFKVQTYSFVLRKLLSIVPIFAMLKEVSLDTLQQKIDSQSKLIPLPQSTKPQPYQIQKEIRNFIADCRIIQEIKFSEKQRYSFFVVHLKPNNYMDYLQSLIDQNIFYHSIKIDYWKRQIRYCQLDKQQNQLRIEVSQTDIDDAVFYLQVRDLQKYLYGDSQQIYEFPELKSKAIQNLITHRELRALNISSDFCVMFIRILNRCKKYNDYQQVQKFNLFQKCLLLYHLTYYEVSITIETNQHLKEIAKNERIDIIEDAFSHLFDNQTLLQILDLYIFQIRLGNYHKSKSPKTINKINSVYQRLYQRLLMLIYHRIKNILIEYRQIQTTLQLKNLVLMTNYFALLTRALSKENETIYACQNCKIRIEFLQCPFCWNISIGINLVAIREHSLHIFDFQGIRDMAQQIKKLVQQLIEKLEKLKLDHESKVEWPHMLLLILKRMQSIVYTLP